jgi:hypothetical protein
MFSVLIPLSKSLKLSASSVASGDYSSSTWTMKVTCYFPAPTCQKKKDDDDDEKKNSSEKIMFFFGSIYYQIP